MAGSRLQPTAARLAPDHVLEGIGCNVAEVALDHASRDLSTEHFDHLVVEGKQDVSESSPRLVSVRRVHGVDADVLLEPGGVAYFVRLIGDEAAPVEGMPVERLVVR